MEGETRVVVVAGGGECDDDYVEHVSVCACVVLPPRPITAQHEHRSFRAEGWVG